MQSIYAKQETKHGRSARAARAATNELTDHLVLDEVANDFSLTTRDHVGRVAHEDGTLDLQSVH